MLSETLTSATHPDHEVRVEGALSLSDIVALIGHELRTPLTTIEAATEMLESVDPGEAQPLRTILRRQVGRLLALFDAALRSAEIVGGARVDPRAHSDPVVVVGELVAAFGAQGDKPTISFESEQQLPRVAIEAGALTIAVNNLITNAVRHSGSSEVIVTARRSGARVLISVVDDGGGVPQRLRGRLFELENPDGPGDRWRLGLYVARRLLQSFGGDVHLEDGRVGSCFVAALPAWKP